jgi:hypothetical protein
MSEPEANVRRAIISGREPKAWPAVIAVLCLLLNGCSGEADRVFAEASRCAEVISRGLDCAAPPTSNSNQTDPSSIQKSPRPHSPSDPKLPGNTNSEIEESRVYLDATESMKGYSAVEGTTFTRLIESLSYAMPGSHLYKYGVYNNRSRSAAKASRQATEDFAREIRFSQDLRHSSFYDLSFNEDDVLFDHLAREERPVRSVLITDGVYSARESELASAEINAIHKWLAKGHCFGILIFTSPFEGQLYSENRRNWLSSVKVAARPFYAFVFSPDERGFRDLEEKLAVEFKDMRVLLFPSEAVSCSLLPILKQGLERRNSPPLSRFFLQMYNQTVFDKQGSTEVAFDLQCLPADDYPIAALKIDVTLNRYWWQQGTFKLSPSPSRFDYSYAAIRPAPTVSTPSVAPVTGRATPSPPETRPRLRVTLSRDTESPYSLYHISLSLATQTLRPEIRALSTEDDSQLTEAEKTYRFFEFVSALTTVHLKTPTTVRWPAPIFVLMTNK